MRSWRFYDSRGEFDDLSALYLGIAFGVLISTAAILLAVFV